MGGGTFENDPAPSEGPVSPHQKSEPGFTHSEEGMLGDHRPAPFPL